jgi:Tol biopolymer transport system component
MSLGDKSMSRIMVLNAKTGGARQVVGVEGFDPAFSPDGHSLAFKRILGPDTNAKRIEGIWIVGLDGSTLHQVTNVDPRVPAAFSDSSPQFSPDGKMLVFERTRLEDGDSAVFVQSLDSSGSPEDARQITPWKMECGITPEFSPDGKLVLFRCGPWLEPPSMLWWVHPDGTGSKTRLLWSPAARQRRQCGATSARNSRRASLGGRAGSRRHGSQAVEAWAPRTWLVCVSRTAMWCARRTSPRARWMRALLSGARTPVR